MKKKSKKLNKEKNVQIPDDVKIIFGKFYLFSIFYIVFFFVIFPFLILPNTSLLSGILVFVVLFLFYFYILKDVSKKKANYTSSLYTILGFLVFVSFFHSILVQLYLF